MDYIPDNYDLFRQREAEEAEFLAKCPTCDRCGEKITDEYGYEIDPGQLWCRECVDEWVNDQKVDIEERMREEW